MCQTRITKVSFCAIRVWSSPSRRIHCFKIVESNVMDEDFYDEMNDESVVEKDEEIRPPHNVTTVHV